MQRWLLGTSSGLALDHSQRGRAYCRDLHLQCACVTDDTPEHVEPVPGGRGPLEVETA